METTPIPTQELSAINPESREKALELIQSIVKEYDESIRQIIEDYLNTSEKIIGAGKMQNDAEQRKVLLPMVDKIGLLFKQLKDALDEAGYSEREPSHIASLRSLYTTVLRVGELLTKAPDERYSKVNLEEGYEGKENVPAGTASYEDTRKAVQNLKSTINGIKIGLGFLKE